MNFSAKTVKHLRSQIILAALFIGAQFSPLAHAHSQNNCAKLLTESHLWLEEIEGQRATVWVNNQNARTLQELQTKPQYAAILAETRSILMAKDKVPFAEFSEGYFYDFWQDKDHKHGLLRKTTYEEYVKDNPQWQTLLDLDQLSKDESENWVYVDSKQLVKGSSQHLIFLSRGGKDACVVREFDYQTGKFVDNGFYVAEARTNIAPIDQDHVLIASEFGPNSLTDSGYPRTVKLWQRGESLTQAKDIYSSETADLGVFTSEVRHGNEHYLLLTRAVDYYHSEFYLLEPDTLKPRKIELPTTAQLIDIRDGQVYAGLREPIVTRKRILPGNSVIRFALTANSIEKSEVIYQAEPGQSIEQTAIAKDRVFITILKNVRSQVLEIKTSGSDAFIPRELPFPKTGAVSFRYRNEEDPTDFSTLYYTDHLTPYGQYRVNDGDNSFALELLKSGPQRFDSQQLEVVQNFAISADGVRIPYFVIKKKNLKADGKNPTILYGYGGFRVSLTPSYQATRGKVWLERGGVYVIANIRGGAEFGPEWHEAALKENRQKAYDDFIAVAQDLIAHKITSPAHLGAMGGSNGGLLVGAVMTQRPDLFNAAVIQVPLLDMLRYSKLLAGASWIGEYGDPEIPEEREHLMRISPYHNLKASEQYPHPLFTTSTKDDRVHPGHARRMAARMAELGHSFYYFENQNGGHAGSANLEEQAQMLALEYTYLWSRLAGRP